jgi:hypothetical protein
MSCVVHYYDILVYPNYGSYKVPSGTKILGAQARGEGFVLYVEKPIPKPDTFMSREQTLEVFLVGTGHTFNKSQGPLGADFEFVDTIKVVSHMEYFFHVYARLR